MRVCFGHRQEIPQRFVERTTDLRVAVRRLPDADACVAPAGPVLPATSIAALRRTIACWSAGSWSKLPFYAQRLFAAGQEYFGAYFGSEANERFAFDRLAAASACRSPSSRATRQDEFDTRFPLVAGYVHARFTSLTEVPVDEEQTIHILVNRDLPATATGCLRPAGPVFDDSSPRS